MDTTTNYNLKKPSTTDFYNIEDFNDNADIIDQQMKTNADNIAKIVAIKTATITTTWVGSSAPYTQEVTVAGITADDEPIISPVYSATLATALLEKEAWNQIGKIETGTNKITITCFEDKPITAIPIQIKGV